MPPGEDSRIPMSWLPMGGGGGRYVGKSRTSWGRMAEKERSEELVWKNLEEACQVSVKGSEWRRIVKPYVPPRHR